MIFYKLVLLKASFSLLDYKICTKEKSRVTIEEVLKRLRVSTPYGEAYIEPWHPGPTLSGRKP